MDENINLCEILKNCPKGTKFYSYIYGEVEFIGIDSSNADYPIHIKTFLDDGTTDEDSLTKEGRYSIVYKSSKCILVPSFEQPDWSKWKCLTRFDPKTLKAFDKILVKCTSIYNSNLVWRADIFSYLYEDKDDDCVRCYTISSNDSSPSIYVIPYNDDMKHLVNTEDEAPEYYRYWED